jgi:hypothetical protein
VDLESVLGAVSPLPAPLAVNVVLQAPQRAAGRPHPVRGGWTAHGPGAPRPVSPQPHGGLRRPGEGARLRCGQGAPPAHRHPARHRQGQTSPSSGPPASPAGCARRSLPPWPAMPPSATPAPSRWPRRCWRPAPRPGTRSLRPSRAPTSPSGSGRWSGWSGCTSPPRPSPRSPPGCLPHARAAEGRGASEGACAGGGSGYPASHP